MKKYFNNPEKRIYSFNLLAFIEMRTGIETELHQDQEKKGLFYGLFPEDEKIKNAINEYRQKDCQVNLHDYLHAFKKLRDRINEIRKAGV